MAKNLSYRNLNKSNSDLDPKGWETQIGLRPIGDRSLPVQPIKLTIQQVKVQPVQFLLGTVDIPDSIGETQN